MNPSQDGSELRGAPLNRLNDLQRELAGWGHGRIEKKRKELAMLHTYLLTETRADEGTMTAIPKPEDGTVTFKMDPESKCGDGKTGPISCESSFTVEVTLVRGCDDNDNWDGTIVALVASDIPLDEIEKTLSSVGKKEDPNIHAYGMPPYWPQY